MLRTGESGYEVENFALSFFFFKFVAVCDVCLRTHIISTLNSMRNEKFSATSALSDRFKPICSGKCTCA